MTHPNREPVRPCCTGREDEPAVLAVADQPTERQREKVQQELLTRADDMHEYLMMKGRL
jgi:hypothetical protein